jgi:hypothetical protein
MRIILFVVYKKPNARESLKSSMNPSIAPGPLFPSMFIGYTHIYTRTINQRYFLSKCEQNPITLRRYLLSLISVLSLFFAKELARRPGSEHLPTVVAVNPGYCSTDLDSEFKAYTIQRYLTQASDYFIARSPEMGSRTLIHAAVSEDDLNGKYLANCRVERASEFSLSEEGLEVQKRLWVRVHLLRLPTTLNIMDV